MKNWFRNYLRKWLGVDSYGYRLEAIETLVLHRESRINGFATLKKHLNRPDKPLPNFAGKPIEQD